MRIDLAGAAKLSARVASNSERRDIQRRMLAGQQEMRIDAGRGERMGDGSKLDGFRPGADDQANSLTAQPSP